MTMEKLTTAVLTPAAIAATCSVLAVGATGFALVKWSGSKRGIKSLKRFALTVRNKANEYIEQLDTASENIGKAVAQEIKVH